MKGTVSAGTVVPLMELDYVERNENDTAQILVSASYLRGNGDAIRLGCGHTRDLVSRKRDRYRYLSRVVSRLHIFF